MSVFFDMLEVASAHHNANMAGNKWTSEKEHEKLLELMPKIFDRLGVNPEVWLDILNDCRNAISDMAERYPSEWVRLERKYDTVIDDIYNLIK
jgi:hypothetical protein